MKKLVLFIAALLLTVPAFAQVQIRSSGQRPQSTPQSTLRSHGTRPTNWNHRPPTWNHRPPTWNHRPPTWNHRPPTWGWSSWHHSAWGPRVTTSWGWWQPMPSSVHFRTTIGVASVNGFVWNNVRFVPPAPFTIVHPPHPQTIVVVPEGATILVNDQVVIVNTNGRLTIYRAEVNGQQ